MITPSLTISWLQERWPETLAALPPDAQRADMIMAIRRRCVGNRRDWALRLLADRIVSPMLHAYWGQAAPSRQDLMESGHYAKIPLVEGVRVLVFGNRGRWRSFSRKLDPYTVCPYELPVTGLGDGLPGRFVADATLTLAPGGKDRLDPWGIIGETPAQVVWEVLAHPNSREIQQQAPVLEMRAGDVLMLAGEDLIGHQWVERRLMLEQAVDRLGGIWRLDDWTTDPVGEAVSWPGVMYKKIDGRYDVTGRRTQAWVKRTAPLPVEAALVRERERYFDPILNRPDPLWRQVPPSWGRPVPT